MSVEVGGTVLDSDRLSVRNQSDPVETAENGQSRFSENPDYSEIPFTDKLEAVRATVEEGDTRTLETVEEAVDAFEDYLIAKENANLVMREKNEGDLLVLPHNHRWTAAYRKMTYAKLKAAEDYIKDEYGNEAPTTLLTLTAPHKDENGDYRAFADVLDDIKAGWDKARRVIRRETDGIKTSTLTVFEPHGDGYPHLHVLVFGVARPSMGEKIQDYWTERYVEGASKKAQDVNVKRGRSAQIGSPAQYVMKYLSKTLIREGEETGTAKESVPTIEGYRQFSALLWATGARHYTMSEDMSQAVKEAEPDNETVGDWEYVGTASGLEEGLYSGEEAEKLEKYMANSRNQTHPPRSSDYIQRRVPPDRGGVTT